MPGKAPARRIDSIRTIARALAGPPVAVMIALVFALSAGCINIDIPAASSLFPTGTSFVLQGTASTIDENGPCLVWLADNGLTYHLFQDPRVDNADFDAVTTPGVRSRLELATRADLEVDCQVGTIVEVQSVLEIDQ